MVATRLLVQLHICIADSSHPAKPSNYGSFSAFFVHSDDMLIIFFSSLCFNEHGTGLNRPTSSSLSSAYDLSNYVSRKVSDLIVISALVHRSIDRNRRRAKKFTCVQGDCEYSQPFSREKFLPSRFGELRRTTGTSRVGYRS